MGELKFFTYWSLLFVFLYLTLVLVDYIFYARKRDEEQRKESKFWKVIHIVYATAWTFQFVTVVFFWGILFPRITPDLMNSNPQFPFLLITEHSFFGFVAFLELFFNHCMFNRFNLTFIFIFALLYLYTNFMVNWITRNPVYPYMTWNNWETFWYIVITQGLGYLGYWIGWQVNENWKHPRKCHQEAALLSSYKNLGA